MTNRVPNQFPAFDPPGPARIAIVGQSPGQTEIDMLQPFVGPSGKYLDSLLSSVGIARGQCFVGNVCQSMPPGGNFDNLDWQGEEVQAGIAALLADLLAFRPTIVLCLGNEALHLFKEGNVAPPRKGKSPVWPNSISSWRGSLFVSPWLEGVKCLGTYHPAAVLREWSLSPYCKFDARRLAKESITLILVLPKRDIRILAP